MDERTIKILLVEDNPVDARLFQEYLKGSGAFAIEVAGSLGAAVAAMVERQFDVVVMDLTLPDSRGLDTFYALQKAGQRGPFVVLSGLDNEELAIQAVRDGAEDYLVKGRIDQAALARAIRYALERHHRKAADDKKFSRVVSFLGANGGAGATTTAWHVASAWAQGGKSTALCELRCSPGGLAKKLGVAPPAQLTALLDLRAEAITAPEVNRRLVRQQSGLRVLFGPQRATDFREITPEAATALIKATRENAELTALDLPIHYSDGIRAAIQSSDYVVILVETEPSSAAAARTALEFVESSGGRSNAVGVVAVHRMPVQGALSVHEIRSLLACTLIGVLPPAADALLMAYKAGTPLVISRPESNYAIAASRLAVRLAADPVTPFEV